MKLFEKINMAAEDVQAYNITGVCASELFDGEFVSIGDLVDHEVYSGIKDMNTRAIAAYDSTAGGRYGIVDAVLVSSAMINGVLYREGDKTAGLPVPANTPIRVRAPKVGDMFYLGDGDFSNVVSVASAPYGVYDAAGKYKTQASAATSGFCFKIEYETNKITGQVNDGKKYCCTVIAE